MVTLHKHVFPLASSKKHAGNSCISMFSCWFPQKNMPTTLTQSCFSARFQKKTCRQLLHKHVFPPASRKNMPTTLAQACFPTRFLKKHAGHSCISMFSCSLPGKTLQQQVCFSWKSPKSMITASIEKQKTEKIYVGFIISCMKAA